MRVIAGSARRLLLKTLPSDAIRPTTDRIKETLFNMIQFEIPGCRFLDLFSGSGAIAIEALSRGASHAVMIESDSKATSIIHENLEKTHLVGIVMNMDALSALKKIEKTDSKSFDIIFMDPPYGKGLEDACLKFLANSSIADADTIFIVEMAKNDEHERFCDMGYSITKVKEYKTNKHVFLSRN